MTERGKLSWFRCRAALVFSALEMNLNQGGIAWLVLTTWSILCCKSMHDL